MEHFLQAKLQLELINRDILNEGGENHNRTCDSSRAPLLVGVESQAVPY